VPAGRDDNRPRACDDDARPAVGPIIVRVRTAIVRVKRMPVIIPVVPAVVDVSPVMIMVVVGTCGRGDCQSHCGQRSQGDFMDGSHFFDWVVQRRPGAAFIAAALMARL
jgi:hypothetical protein